MLHERKPDQRKNPLVTCSRDRASRTSLVPGPWQMRPSVRVCASRPPCQHGAARPESWRREAGACAPLRPGPRRLASPDRCGPQNLQQRRTLPCPRDNPPAHAAASAAAVEPLAACPSRSSLRRSLDYSRSHAPGS
jgi:hypothetical protein